MKIIKKVKIIKIYDNAKLFDKFEVKNLYIGHIKKQKSGLYSFRFNPLINIEEIDENLIKEIYNQINILKIKDLKVCELCGVGEHKINFKGSNVCKSCINDLYGKYGENGRE